MAALREKVWMLALVYGVVFVLVGGFVLFQGLSAKALVVEGLKAEGVKTSSDAELFGVPAGTPVLDAKTAIAQSKVIEYHTLAGEPKVVDGKIVDGIYYAEMERGDPARDRYLSGLPLRNALNLAAMGYQIANFVAAIGGILIVNGLAAIIFIAVPQMQGSQVASRTQTVGPRAA